MVLSVLAKVLAGVVLGGIVGAIATGDWIYTIVWSVALGPFILVMVLGGVRSALRPAASGLALARIEHVTRTGRSVADAPELDVRLTVAPDADIPYQTTTRLAPDGSVLRRFSPGAVLVVARPSPSRPDVAVLAVPPPEWAARAAAAERDPSSIPPASAVPAWETATTTAPGTARPGRRRRSWLAATVSVLLIVATAALVTLPAWPAIGRGATAIATGRFESTDLARGDYQQLAVDAIVAVAGHDDFTTVLFYPDYVLADGLSAPGATTTDSFTYRYGRAWRDGPELIQPTDLRAELFNVSSIDFSVVGVVVRDAIASTEVSEVTGVYATVAKDADAAAPVIHVYLSGPYGGDHRVFDLDGRPVP